MTTPLDSHGTMFAVQLTPGGAFTDIAELGDLLPPELSSKETDASVHNRKIDNYVLSELLRRSAVTFPINFIPTEQTHDHLTGLYQLKIANTITGWRVKWSDGTVDGTPWIMSGQVQAIKPKAMVEGKLEADVTVRMSGYMSIGGVLIGT